MWKIFIHPDYATLWSAVGAIATGIAALLGAIALIYTIFAFRKSLKMSHYTTLDSMYMDLLKLTLDRPYLKTPSPVPRRIPSSSPGETVPSATVASKMRSHRSPSKV